MKKLTIIAVAAWMLAACSTPVRVQKKYYGEVTNIQCTSRHGCKYKVTAWDAEHGRWYYVYTDIIYQVGDVIEL